MFFKKIHIDESKINSEEKTVSDSLAVDYEDFEKVSLEAILVIYLLRGALETTSKISESVEYFEELTKNIPKETLIMALIYTKEQTIVEQVYGLKEI